ncbi:MAG: RnfABCDGE type electron transport complex subunit D [bacterium]|nr:RnfABCDGE type electron transport complex subunit D [bacterium]
MNNELIHSNPPHIHTKRTITGIRADILIALAPTVIMSALTKGGKSLLIVLVSLAAAVISDVLCDLIFRKRTAVLELESAVTGVIFALMLPYRIPLWIAAVGAAIAVIVFKQFVGLIGRSYLHPAAGAYLTISCLLLIIAPFGIPSGSICAGVAPTLIVGLIYLLIRKVIQLRIPLLYTLAYVFAMTVSESLGAVSTSEFIPGSLLLTAVFIAPAYASSPATPAGRAVFAVFGGFIAYAFSNMLLSEQALALSIIIMNILSPIIERFTIPKSWRYQK